MIDHGRRTVLIEEIGREFVDDLTQSFWSDSWPLFDEALACETAGDIKGLRRVLHTIAGSAGNIGFTGIAQAAEAAGLAAKTGDHPDLTRIREAMNQTAVALEARAAA